MLKQYLLAILFAAMVFSTEPAQARQGPFPQVAIGGTPMYCRSSFGQQVAIFIDPQVNQNIGRAMNNGYPVIILGPGFFNWVPPLVGQFWFLHECAHHVVGGNEAASDCFAIRNLRNLGLVTHQG
ncbi:MAG: hypothetical protein RLN96_09310, partial [Pseudomonadales bacterium]